MKIISASEKTEYSIEYFLKYLPEHLAKPIAFISEPLKKEIQEIRLRTNSPLSVTTPKNNFIISERGQITETENGIFVTEKDIEKMIADFCENSYHVQADNIERGFIMTKDGYRIGVSGEYTGNIPSSKIVKITSLNIRISRFAAIPYNPVYELIKTQGIKSVLIYSPPSNAKTTFIRNLSNVLSKGMFGLKKYRVALIDERREIFLKDKMSGGLLDVYFGCDKAKGIECAVRTMNPEVIICDEIGTYEDIEAILKGQNSGVPFIATTHAGNFKQLFCKPNIKRLIDNNIFDYAAGIRLRNDIICGGNMVLEYKITSFDEDVFIEKNCDEE